MTTPPTPPTDNLAAEGGPRSEMSEQEQAVEAIGTWLEHYLGNYTFPANYAAPLYGQTHREVAKYVGPVIAEDLLDSPALADLLAARDRRVRGEALREAAEAAVTARAHSERWWEQRAWASWLRQRAMRIEADE